MHHIRHIAGKAHRGRWPIAVSNFSHYLLRCLNSETTLGQRKTRVNCPADLGQMEPI